VETRPVSRAPQTPDRPPWGMPRAYRTAVKVGLAVLVLIGLVWVVVGTGLLPPKPATYVAPWGPARSATVSPDGRQVTVHYIGGACDEGAEAQVDESAAQVKVTVVVTEQRGDCPAMAVPRSITFELKSPLGSRRLVDGSRT